MLSERQENVALGKNLSTPENQVEEMEETATHLLEDLGLTWDSLRGKLTLDVGAGSAVIATVAKRKGIKVISLDKDPEMWMEAERRGEKMPYAPYIKYMKDAPYAKADAEHLPFQDGAFDFVISHAGPLSFTKTRDESVRRIEEAERVLKDGGEIRFSPGNLNASFFSELFTPEEEESFTIDQRIERIGEKTLDFLKSMNPNSTRKLVDSSSPRSSFCVIRKVVEEG